MLPVRRSGSIKIASGGSLSGGIHLSDYTAVRIDMPAGWDAAVLTFQVSHDGTNWLNLYDNFGVEVNVPAAAAQAVLLDPTIFFSAQWMKVRSGTAASAVNQTADRSLTVVEALIP